MFNHFKVQSTVHKETTSFNTTWGRRMKRWKKVDDNDYDDDDENIKKCEGVRRLQCTVET